MKTAERWQPLLPDDLADEALAVAEEIAAASAELPAVPQRYMPGDHVALASGWAGRALFLGYLERARPGRGWGERAVELLDQAIEELTEVPADHALYCGFTGVAWVLEHLQGWLLDGGEDPGEEIAAAVAGALRAAPWRAEFDLIGGLAGLGVYALERAARPGGRESLRRVVDHLAALAERQDGTAGWKTPPERVPHDRRELFPQGYFFTGVAHGAAGVIALLGEAQAAGWRAGRCWTKRSPGCWTASSLLAPERSSRWRSRRLRSRGPPGSPGATVIRASPPPCSAPPAGPASQSGNARRWPWRAGRPAAAWRRPPSSMPPSATAAPV